MRRLWASFRFFLVLAVWPGPVAHAQHSPAPESPVRTWLVATFAAMECRHPPRSRRRADGHIYPARRQGHCPTPRRRRLRLVLARSQQRPRVRLVSQSQHHIPALFVAWRETKDARYRTALNDQLRDWLRQNPRPAFYSFSSSWRALEVARRAVEAWLPVLFAPEASAALDPDV